MLYILMNFPIQIDAVMIVLSIIYFKGSQVEISRLWCFYIPEDCLYLNKW